MTRLSLVSVTLSPLGRLHNNPSINLPSFSFNRNADICKPPIWNLVESIPMVVLQSIPLRVLLRHGTTIGGSVCFTPKRQYVAGLSAGLPGRSRRQQTRQTLPRCTVLALPLHVGAVPPVVLGTAGCTSTAGAAVGAAPAPSGGLCISHTAKAGAAI